MEPDYSTAIVRGDLEAVRAFCRDFGPNSFFGRVTALAIAVERDQAVVVEFLLATGADPNLVDLQEPDVPLVRALDLIADCASNNISAIPDGRVVELLLTAHANPSLRNFAGEHALDVVSRIGARYLKTKYERLLMQFWSS